MIPLIFISLVGCALALSVVHARKRDIPTLVPFVSQFIPIGMSATMFALFVIHGGSPAISATSGFAANSVALLWRDVWLGLLLLSFVSFLLHLVVGAGFLVERRTEGVPLLLVGTFVNGITVFAVMTVPPSI